MKTIKKIWGVIVNALKWAVAATSMYFICNAIHPRIRPFLWKLAGVKIKGKICIGYDVYFDVNNSGKIIIEDGVWITSRSLLLCHKRDITNYKYGDDYNKLPYHIKPVHLKKGCCIGMGSIIMPGVTIGEGAIIGAGSVVSKDIPPYTVAVGNPCKVVKILNQQ